MFLRNLILRVSGWRWVENLVRKSFLFRPVVKRFIGGDDFAQGLVNAEPLLSAGFLISFDLLGESVATEEEANASKRAYQSMIQAVKDHPRFVPYRLRPDDPAVYDQIESINISIKLTQCGLDISTELAESNYRETLDAAADAGVFVRVDMESSKYTEATVAMIERVHGDHPHAGTVLQSYLRRTDDDLTRLNLIRSRIRLVKGAYLEPEEVAYTAKSEVDDKYLQFAKRMLSESQYPAFATHDERLIDLILAAAQSQGIDPSRFEFQMLYGIRRDLQDRLLRDGYRVRVYVPFGDAWYPYFSRRLAERPANLGFILKAMFRR